MIGNENGPASLTNPGATTDETRRTVDMHKRTNSPRQARLVHGSREARRARPERQYTSPRIDLIYLRNIFDNSERPRFAPHVTWADWLAMSFATKGMHQTQEQRRRKAAG